MSDRGTVLMLVWTGVSTDTRVLREAESLVRAGLRVHIIGRAVPPFEPPGGVTVAGVGLPPRSAGRNRALSRPERFARWLLLRQHVHARLVRWQAEALGMAEAWAAAHGPPVAVHAHDLSALPPAATVAARWRVPHVYDSHEFWQGRPLEGLAHPGRAARDRRQERALGSAAAAVITVGEGVAAALHEAYGWDDISVVRNTFPRRADLPPPLVAPKGFIYAGRLAPFRELETIAAASESIGLPVELVGPADGEWLGRFQPGRADVLPSESLADLDRRMLNTGAALVTHSDRWANHRLALPNKLFHAVSLGLPVVATDVGELAKIVREFELGTLYRPGDAASLVEAAHRLVADYPSHVAAVAAARDDLSWGSDEARLLLVYDRLMAAR